jgi:CDP-paratose 2-epimerase
MKILITGGCGFVGSNLAIFLKNYFNSVSSLDNLYRKGSLLNLKRINKKGIRNYKIDIKNEKKIFELPKFDLIIDCCAEASVEKSRSEVRRVFETNLLGTLNILQKCKRDNAKILFLSTSRVYSIESLNKLINKKIIKNKISLKKEITSDFDTFNAKSIYGFTKLASEDLIREFSYLYKIKYLINRCGVIAGPWQFGKVDQGFVSLWVWRHINKKIIKYIGYGGNGHQVRDVIHISDLCELILKQIRSFDLINNKIFSVGGGYKNSISLSSLTSICKTITGNPCKIKKIKTTSIYDIPYFISSNKQVSKTYNWVQKKNIKELVRDVYNWQLENIHLLKKFI